MNNPTKETVPVEIDSSGYYLCEEIWLNEFKKTLVDQRYPNHNPLIIAELSTQILIVEREMSEWLFHPMNVLMEDDNDPEKSYKPFKNGIFILFGAFTYIEKMQRYREGQAYKKNATDSSKIIKDGFGRIFTDIQGGSTIDKILEPTRHTLMHEGMVGDDVLLNYAFGLAICYDEQKVKINPIKLLETLKEDFENYIQELKQGEDSLLVENFKKVFNEVYGDEIQLLSN